MAETYEPLTARFIGPDEIERGIANTLKCPVYRAGALVAPSAGTVSVYSPSNEAVVSGASVTITGSIAQYTLTAGLLAAYSYDIGWRVEWTLTVSGETFTPRNDAVLVYRRLWPVVTDADLFRSHTDLSRRTPSGESSYQDYVDEAWAQIKARLIGAGVRPFLVLSPSAFREAHLYRTLALVFADLATGGEGTAEWSMMQRYEGMYEAAWARLTFVQATPDGASLGGGRRRAVDPVIFLCGRS